MKAFLPLFIAATVTLATTCHQTESGIEPPPSMVVGISYVNEEGKDLIDPNTLNFFNIYYLQLNEETEELERIKVRDAHYSFYRDESSNLIALRLFPNREFIDGHSQTLIESPRDDFDTLTVQGRKEGRGAVAEIIWYNEKKVWETAQNPSPRYFIIKKQSSF